MMIHESRLFGDSFDDAVPTPRPRDPVEVWAERIAERWQDSVEAILDVGRLLIRAKAMLSHGQWEGMCNTRLPFGLRTAQRLMAIANDERLLKATHGSLLPPNWRTLYELTTLDDDVLARAFRDGVVRPEMERSDIAKLEAQQARERAKPRAEDTQIIGGTVADLDRLAVNGYRAGVILADPPWPFATWSHIGLAGDTSQERRAQRSRAAPYKTMTHEDIYALPIKALAAKDCALFLWIVQTQLPQAFELLQRWGFEFTSVAFAWVKGDEDGEIIEVPMGCGYWTRAGFEQCWIATRGNPQRLYADVRQVIVERRREHSRKPDCTHERIERLVAGPYLELFARKLRPGWTCWGDEIPSESIVTAEENP